MFEIEMLPAREGDCLWLRYGSAKAPRQILIDAGRKGTYRDDLAPRLRALPKARRTFELLVITHVDRDHIEGVLSLLEDATLDVKFKEIWFNGFDHLKSAKLETFGAVQGERLTALLLKHKAAWNTSFGGKAVALRGKTLPKIKLAGGMTLTLLSPDRQKLLELVDTWVDECLEAGLIPGKKARRAELKGLESFGAVDVDGLAATPFDADKTRANGSSIAFIAQYDKKRALLAADAHVDRLLPSLKTLANGKKRVALNLFKIAHHCSDANVSKELLDLVDCPLYLISTSGAYFKHPTDVAIARILKFGGANKTLAFNYRSKYTDPWKAPALQSRYGYSTQYPAKKTNGTLCVTLAP